MGYARLGHDAPGPVGCFARRGRAGQFEHFRDGLGRQRGPAEFAGYVVQKVIYALLAISLLPTLDGGATDPGPPRYLQHGQSFGGMQDNLCPLNVLQRAIAITHDGRQSVAIFGMGKDIDGLNHDPRFAYMATLVNSMIVSVHELGNHLRKVNRVFKKIEPHQGAAGRLPYTQGSVSYMDKCIKSMDRAYEKSATFRQASCT